MTNEAQFPMMKSMLNSAMKCGMPMNLFHCYILSTNKEAARYKTDKFKVITVRKLEVIHANMKLDHEVLWVDNDIVFFQNCLSDILSKSGDFVMQDDGWGHCTGFFLARHGLFAKQVIKKSISWLKIQENMSVNDQDAFNYIIKHNPITIFSLSNSEYPNGKVYFEEHNQSKARMVHCNWLFTTAEKVNRLKESNLWDESDVAFGLVNKYYI